MGLLTVLVCQVMEERGLLAPVDWWFARDLGLSLGVMVVTVLAAAAVQCWVLLPAADRRFEQETRLLRAAREPVLRRWLDLSPDEEVTDIALWQWVEYRAVGLTDEIADRWVAAGYHPGVAAAAVQAGATHDQVYELAAAMVRAGALDGQDRAAVNDLIGWHLDIFNTPWMYPVLSRWLALPLPVVEQRARDLVDAAPHDLTYT